MRKNQFEDIVIISVIIAIIYGIYSFFTSNDEEIEVVKPIEVKEIIQKVEPKITQAIIKETIKDTNKTIEKVITKNETIVQDEIKKEPVKVIKTEKEEPKKEIVKVNPTPKIEEKEIVEPKIEIKSVEAVEENISQESLVEVNITNSLVEEEVLDTNKSYMEYIVKSGDTIGKIARSFDIYYKDLKAFNNTDSDIVFIGQVLKIPTSKEYLQNNQVQVKEFPNQRFNTVSEFYDFIKADMLKTLVLKTQTNANFTSKNGFTNIRLTILKSGSYEQLVYQGGDKEYYDYIKDNIESYFPVQIEENLRDKFPRYFRMKIEY